MKKLALQLAFLGLVTVLVGCKKDSAPTVETTETSTHRQATIEEYVELLRANGYPDAVADFDPDIGLFGERRGAFIYLNEGDTWEDSPVISEFDMGIKSGRNLAKERVTDGFMGQRYLVIDGLCLRDAPEYQDEPFRAVFLKLADR